MLKAFAKRLLTWLGLQRIPVAFQPRITKHLIASLLPSQPTIVEAGAHDGTDTLELRRNIPGCTVHAFEPVPEVFARLTSRTKHDAQIRRYNMALGDVSSTMQMTVSSGASDASSSLLKPKEHLVVNPDVSFHSVISVPVVTLDEWMQQQGVSHIDFLWLDLQGYELPALKGSRKTLESVRAIQVEVNLIEVFEGCALYHQVREWLIAQGFKVHTVDFPYENQGDVLFVRDR